MDPKKHNTILIVEDSDEDFYITQRAFKEAGCANPLIRCESGDEALDYLYRQGQYSDPETSPRPSIIFLDLNLPGTDGREVLQTVKKSEELCKIPVIVITTSDAQQDVERCYAAGANSYVHKPVNMERFLDALKRLQTYWFEIVLLPKPESPQ